MSEVDGDSTATANTQNTRHILHKRIGYILTAFYKSLLLLLTLQQKQHPFNGPLSETSLVTLPERLTSGTAIAEGPREALVSRNPATTKHLT